MPLLETSPMHPRMVKTCGSLGPRSESSLARDADRRSWRARHCISGRGSPHRSNRGPLHAAGRGANDEHPRPDAKMRTANRSRGPSLNPMRVVLVCCCLDSRVCIVSCAVQLLMVDWTICSQWMEGKRAHHHVSWRLSPRLQPGTSHCSTC